MATGYDEDGVEDLICGAPPDAGAGGDAGTSDGNPGGRTTDCGSLIPRSATVLGTFYEDVYAGIWPVWSGFLDEFRPNCLFGGWGQNFEDEIPVAPPGPGTSNAFAPAGGVNSDFSLEVWVKLRMDPTFIYAAAPLVLASRPPIVATTLPHMSFTAPAVGNPTIGFISYGGQIRARYTDTGATELEVNMTVSPGWHHWAINCARGGNIEAFVDGISQGVQAGVLAYTRGDVSIMFGEDTASDRWGWHGPIATHSALLTAAQLKDSVTRRYVQLNANTEWATDPAQLYIDRAMRDADAWYWMWVDNRIGAGAQVALLGRTIDNWFFGTNGGVGRGSMDSLYALVNTGCVQPITIRPSIPDLTGNGRHQGFRCEVFQAPAVFSSDPFWV